MRALKNNWLRAGITLLFLLGAFFVVKAMEERKAFTEVKAEQTVYWYQRIGANQYQQVSNPSSLCDTNSTDEICALGFNTELDEADVNDSMASSAPHKRYIPEE